MVLVSGCFFIELLLEVNNTSFLKWKIPIGILGLLNAGFGLGAFFWLWFAVRCPKCKGGVAAYILRQEDAGKWFTTLISIKNCPLCKN